MGWLDQKINLNVIMVFIINIFFYKNKSDDGEKQTSYTKLTFQQILPGIPSEINKQQNYYIVEIFNT